MLRWVFLVAALVLGGCKKKRELPASVPYALTVAFVDGGGQYVQNHPARGGTLYRGGKPLGAVDTSDHRDRVKFTLPSSELPSTWGAVELVLPTPCGEKRIPMDTTGLRPRSGDERNWLAAQLELGTRTAELTIRAPSSAVSGSQTIRVEWDGANEPLSIGKLVVPPGTSPVTVVDPGCQAEVALRLGDKEFAKLAEASSNAFILAKPNACFSVEHIGYGVAGSAPEVVKTPYYGAGIIDFFLQPPDMSAEVAKGSNSTYRLSVQNAACAQAAATADTPGVGAPDKVVAPGKPIEAPAVAKPKPKPPKKRAARSDDDEGF